MFLCCHNSFLIIFNHVRCYQSDEFTMVFVAGRYVNGGWPGMGLYLMISDMLVGILTQIIFSM